MKPKVAKAIFAVSVLCFAVGVQLFLPQLFEAKNPKEELEVAELHGWLMILAIGAVVALLVMAVKAIKNRLAAGGQAGELR